MKEQADKIVKEIEKLEAELNELIRQKKIEHREVEEQLFKVPTDKEVIQMVVHYLSDDSNFDEAIKMCKAEGVDTTAAELREFVKEPVKKKTKKFYSALINGAYKQIETNLKMFRNATIDTPPSPRKGKKFATEITYQVMDMLEVYWANDLPENENRKSWFHKIADENAMTFSNVAEIERKYRPPKFTPKR